MIWSVQDSKCLPTANISWYRSCRFQAAVAPLAWATWCANFIYRLLLYYQSIFWTVRSLPRNRNTTAFITHLSTQDYTSLSWSSPRKPQAGELPHGADSVPQRSRHPVDRPQQRCKLSLMRKAVNTFSKTHTPLSFLKLHQPSLCGQNSSAGFPAGTFPHLPCKWNIGAAASKEVLASILGPQAFQQWNTIK